MKENIEKYKLNIEEGLSNIQVEKRKKEGLVNFDTTSPTKSIKSIIISNFLYIIAIIFISIFMISKARIT